MLFAKSFFLDISHDGAETKSLIVIAVVVMIHGDNAVCGGNSEFGAVIQLRRRVEFRFFEGIALHKILHSLFKLFGIVKFHTFII